MSQSLYTSIGGISAAQLELNVISNNVANLNTTGYKSSAVSFSDVFYSTLSAGTGTSGTAGGTNPTQIGIGVQVNSTTKNFDSGTWIATGKTTDLMLQGNGFFTAESSSGEVFYTRAGNFSFDSNGNLVTSNGYKVIGTDKVSATSSSLDAIQIPQLIIPSINANDNFFSKDITKLNNCS
ncbi:MAG: flagellar hook basal-body protein, partial [bacterium]